jgi:competence protein ComEA
MASLESRDALWGWTAPVRVLLACVGFGLSCWLLIASGDPTEAPAGAMPVLVVDPNTAPAAVLSALPRLGPVRTRAILDARGQRPFRSLEDFDARVRGVGPATVAALRPHLRFGDTPNTIHQERRSTP